MEEMPLFENHTQAINVMFNMTRQLAMSVGWIAFLFFHLTLCVALLFVLWACDLSPHAVTSAFLALLQSSPLLFAASIGLPVTAVAVGYWKLVRWLNTEIFGQWLTRYLLKGSIR